MIPCSVVHFHAADDLRAIEAASLLARIPVSVVFDRWDREPNLSLLRACSRLGSKPTLAVWVLSESFWAMESQFATFLDIVRDEMGSALEEICFAREHDKVPRVLHAVPVLSLDQLARGNSSMDGGVNAISNALGLDHLKTGSILQAAARSLQQDYLWTLLQEKSQRS